MKNLLITLFTINISLCVFAQHDQLYGYVISKIEKEGLPDVKVTLVSYGVDTYTDHEGKFVIDGHFKNRKLTINFLKEGYDYLAQKSVYTNEEGSLGYFDLSLSNKQGLWFSIFENSTNKIMIKDARINVNGQEHWTDENGFKFIPINNPAYLKGDPILITVSKDGYNDHSQKLIYKIGERALEIGLTEKVEIVLKFLAKENSENGKLLQNVEISIDGNIHHTDKSGFLEATVERSGNIVITATKKKYKVFTKTIKNLKVSDIIDIPMDKKFNTKKIIDKVDKGFKQIDKYRKKIGGVKKVGG